MTGRVFRSLLFLPALLSCTRVPVPAPVQQLVTVGGRVLDAATRRPVAGPFQWRNGPTLQHRDARTGQITYAKPVISPDALGYFSLSVPLSADDTSRYVLRLSSADLVGAARWAPGRPVEVLMRPYFRYQADSCRAAADSAHFRPQAPPLDWTPGQFHTWLIQNPHAAPGRILRTIRLQRLPLRDIAEMDAYQPFRLRVMAVDPQTGAPGEDMLTENVVFGFPWPGGTYIFALWDQQIPAEVSQFYVGLQPIISGDKYYTWAPLENYHPIGPWLRAPCAFAATRSWMLPYDSKRGWQRLPAAQNPWPRYESIISLEISPR